MTNVDPAQEPLAVRLADVRARLARAAERSGRKPDEVRLIAISKTHPTPVLKRVIELGATDLGENRVQEARGVFNLFDVIHSLDSVELAQRLDRLCVEEERESLPLLIQVDLGHEETKSGVDESELTHLVESLGPLTRLKLIGLMTLPPFFDDPEQSRPFFRRLRELRDELNQRGAFGDRTGELSMGMTHDFEVAIEEGATMVRIGTAIFGARHKL